VSVRCLGMGERSVCGFEGGEIMLGSAGARGLDGSDGKLYTVGVPVECRHGC